MFTVAQFNSEHNSPIVVESKLSPFALGQLDAAESQPFAPEQYFFWFGDMLDYTSGWESVAGESAQTAAFKGQWPMAPQEDAIEDDYAWIRTGC